MPCEDITEVLELTVDAQDRLRSYAFAKRTCGQGVGATSLLIDQLGGRSVDELLAMTAESFLEEFTILDELEEFLSLKHLFAIQGALEVLVGKVSGDMGEAFSAHAVEYDEAETTIVGEISVDLLTERIESCGGCKGCGKARAKGEARRDAVPAS